MGSCARLVAMLAAIATLSVLPAVAQAAFPGTNGKLAFGSARNGYPADSDLYSMANNGTGQTRITSMSLDELNPSWSPNGAQIAFERNHGLRSDIWIANADGTNLRQLTTHPANDTRPAFSNTGTKIVFASDRNATAVQIAVRPLRDGRNGANQVASRTPRRSTRSYPSLSPDGTSISFSRDGSIYKVSPTGTNLTRLTSSSMTLDRAGLVSQQQPDRLPPGHQRRRRAVEDQRNGSGLVKLTQNGAWSRNIPLVPAGRQDRVHSRRVQRRRGLHDECGRFRGHPHHQQHRHGRQPGLAGDPVHCATSPVRSPAHPCLLQPPPVPPGPGLLVRVPRLPAARTPAMPAACGDGGTACCRGCVGGSDGHARTLVRRGIRLSIPVPGRALSDVRLLRSKQRLGLVGSPVRRSNKVSDCKLDKRAKRAVLTVTAGGSRCRRCPRHGRRPVAGQQRAPFGPVGLNGESSGVFSD